MTVKVLYVAGPMTGYPEFNYPHFMDVEDKLLAQGFTVLNPARADEYHKSLMPNCEDCIVGRKHTWEWYMRQTIAMMLRADGVALLRGWQQSRGAKVEHGLAVTLGMPIASWQTWVLKAYEARGELKRPDGRKNKKKVDES